MARRERTKGGLFECPMPRISPAKFREVVKKPLLKDELARWAEKAKARKAARAASK